MATADMDAGARAQHLSYMVDMIVESFLEIRHYRQLHRILGVQWSGWHSLTAAVRLMEAHNVRIQPDEEQRLAQLPEERMIDALVMRMPQQSREQFEHFCLQLSFIASTTTRLRSAIEAGQPDVVAEAIESAENVGVLSFLMKMAAAQAGQECRAAEQDHDDWLALCDSRIAPLLQAQATAMMTQKALAQCKAQLGMTRDEASEKTKRVLLGLAAGNERAILEAVLNAWHDLAKKMKRETEIRVEYEDQIMEAEKRLIEFKEKQLGNVKSVLMRGAQQLESRLLETCWQAFVDELEEKKTRANQAADVTALEEKLKGYAEAASGNAKKMLTRMNGANDDALVHMCLNAWMTFIAEYNRDREMNDAVKAKEKMVADFMKKQNEGAKSVLNRMSSGSDEAMKQQFLQAWKELIDEDKQATEFQNQMNAKSSKFGSFADKNKGSAMSASQRAAMIFDQGYLIVVYALWKREVKTETIKRRGREKNARRKQELIGVKGLFKNFASELETSLKDGTPRMEDRKAPAQAPKQRSARSSSQPSGR